MIGTLVNVAAVIGGSLLGLFVIRAVPDNIRQLVMQGIGLCVIIIGASMALGTESPVILIGSIALGAVSGELLRLDAGLQRLGQALEKRLQGGASGQFSRGFVTATLVFCVGAMAITGAIDDGLRGDPTVLYAKSALDGVSSIFFASAMGWGVLFSAVPVLVYQGSIALAAGLVKDALSPAVITEMTAAGGVMILAIGLSLLDLVKIRVANMLPALLIAAVLAHYFLAA